jgi:hypothetical protein
MATTTCKDCKATISTEAVACPQCGRPAPKKTSILTWVIALFFGAVIFSTCSFSERQKMRLENPVDSVITPRPPTAAEVAAENKVILDRNIKNLEINTTASLDGFGNVMTLKKLTIKNNNDLNLKDPTISCEAVGKSGTTVTRLNTTIYEKLPAKKTMTTKNINMGFINTQASGYSCEIIAVKFD